MSNICGIWYIERRLNQKYSSNVLLFFIYLNRKENLNKGSEDRTKKKLIKVGIKRVLISTIRLRLTDKLTYIS